MFHAELLFENAFCNAYLGKIKLLNKQILYKRNRKENIFDLKDVSRIIGFIKGVEEQKSFKHIPLIFDIGAIQFADKLTYIILETVCYYVLKNTGRKIRFKLGCDISIDTQGFMFSPIPRFLRNEKLNVDEYLKSLS